MSIQQITKEQLRRMGDQEGLVLQGCGGDPQEWLDGINEILTNEGILKKGAGFEEAYAFRHDGLTCLLFPFKENMELDMGKLAVPRDDHAAEDLANWMRMEKPQAGYQERCYYHKFPDARGMASIYQPKLKKGLTISFDAGLLDGFVEWKMMGVRDYVLGLECGNCYPDGRDVMRKTGMLKFLNPGETIQYEVTIDLR